MILIDNHIFLFLYAILVMFLGAVTANFEMVAAGTVIFAISRLADSLEDITNTSEKRDSN